MPEELNLEQLLDQLALSTDEVSTGGAGSDTLVVPNAAISMSHREGDYGESAWGQVDIIRDVPQSITNRTPHGIKTVLRFWVQVPVPNAKDIKFIDALRERQADLERKVPVEEVQVAVPRRWQGLYTHLSETLEYLNKVQSGEANISDITQYRDMPILDSEGNPTSEMQHVLDFQTLTEQSDEKPALLRLWLNELPRTEEQVGDTDTFRARLFIRQVSIDTGLGIKKHAFSRERRPFQDAGGNQATPQGTTRRQTREVPF